jgi:hypothetical protein
MSTTKSDCGVDRLREIAYYRPRLSRISHFGAFDLAKAPKCAICGRSTWNVRTHHNYQTNPRCPYDSYDGKITPPSWWNC